ncbi:MAG: hypothetical protein WBI70_03235 [Bacillota bacterium]
MRRSIVVVLTLLLVAVLAVPAFGAELEVSGKYVGEIEYNRTLVNSINAGGETEGFDLLGMSTLYLTLDFAEGETVEGHLPLMFYIDGDGGFAVEPSDSFWVVYRGYPFRISLSNQDEGDYAFSSLGDPLGLGDYVEALDDEYVVLKAVGEPYDIDTVAYVIYTAEDVEIAEVEVPYYNIRYGLGRATYEFSDGYTLGLMAGVKHLYERKDEGFDLIRNIGVDISGPLGISEDSAFTAGLALSRTRGVDSVEWSKVSTAAALHLDDMAFGPITFNAAMHLVGEDFVAVAADDDEDAPSDVVAYAGKLNLYGEALTTVNVFDMDFDIQVYDEFEVKADTSRGEDSFNEIGANVEFKPLEPLTIEVDGYYNKSLDPGVHKDDFDTQVYGKGTYVLGDLAEVWARGTWGYGGGLYDEDDDEGDGFYKGYGFRIDGGFNATPLEGVSVEGKAAYQFKDYDFKNGVPAPEANRLDASLYAVAEQSILPDSVERVDFVVAALAKGEDITGKSATKFVGYAHADITIDERFSDKIAVLAGTGDHYATAVHNKLTYTISANSTLGLGCLYREGKVGVDADYTVKIGESTLEIGYGKSGLASKACADADDKGKPWAWLCNSEAVQEPYLVTFKVTVPF